jgi:uncharacterized LabA/DUF88 family protein
MVKTFLFAPKPDDFLMNDKKKKKTYECLNSHRNKDYLTIIEGSHSARPAPGKRYNQMNVEDSSTYYVNEKGTDVNIASHLLTKAFLGGYDTAIVVSGDTDYLPVYDILNTIGKTVIVAGVKYQNLNKFKDRTDKQIIMDHEFFKECVNKTGKKSQNKNGSSLGIAPFGSPAS